MEVKSADNTRAKSYHEFCRRYALEVGYKISMKNIGESKIERTRTVSLPLYLVWNWKRYLQMRNNWDGEAFDSQNK